MQEKEGTLRPMRWESFLLSARIAPAQSTRFLLGALFFARRTAPTDAIFSATQPH
jgi:hypothetical protein